VIDVTQQPWDDDERLLRDLAEAMGQVAPLAETVAEQGMAAFSWRNVDQDLLLAGLYSDSSMQPVTNSRAESGSTRVLVFGTSPLSVELEVTANQILGQIMPPDIGEIQLETADGTTLHITADDLGFFVAPPLTGKLVRLRCDTAAGRLITEWVRL
jgi:hypothetical protein